MGRVSSIEASSKHSRLLEGLKGGSENVYKFDWNEHFIWATFDVVGLYYCIPHTLALSAISYHLKRRIPSHLTYKSFYSKH